MDVTSLSPGNQLLTWQRWLKLFCFYSQIHHFRSKKGTAAEMWASHSKLFLEWLLGKHPSAIGEFFNPCPE